jgi:hypothetical protein
MTDDTEFQRLTASVARSRRACRQISISNRPSSSTDMRVSCRRSSTLVANIARLPELLQGNRD